MRSLRSYLLLPRPGDLVKAWIFPATFALGTIASGVGTAQVLRAALVWLALELLIYQARYQLNDIRGFAADQRHPQAASRGRLPGPPSRGFRHRLASALVAGARLGLAAVLALALPGLYLGPPLLALTFAVFGVALVYEALRSRATGTGGRVPPPLRPTLVALWLVVGGGYAVRGVGGLALALDLGSRPWLATAALVATWAFGVAFVTARWALEALAFGRRGEDGRIIWAVNAGQAREHTLALVRWLPGSTSSAQGGLDEWRPLQGVSPISAPWNLAVLVAAAAAVLTGRLLAGPANPPGTLLAMAAGLLLAACILRCRAQRIPILLLGSVVLAGLLALSGSPQPLMAAIPWLLVVGAHLFFTAQSPASLAHPLRDAFKRGGQLRAPRGTRGGTVIELTDRI